jgi:hypothetical protein
MWEHCSNDSHIFGHGRINYSNSIIITTFLQTLIQNCWEQISSLPTLAIKSPNKIFILLLREFIKCMFYFNIEPVLDIISHIFSWELNFQNNYITPVPLQ